MTAAELRPVAASFYRRDAETVARDLLVYTVAEGVETAREADVCMRLGFTHAQGYYFGRPRPIAEV